MFARLAGLDFTIVSIWEGSQGGFERLVGEEGSSCCYGLLLDCLKDFGFEFGFGCHFVSVNSESTYDSDCPGCYKFWSSSSV